MIVSSQSAYQFVHLKKERSRAMWQIVFWSIIGLIALLLLVACAVVIPLLIVFMMKEGKTKDRVERKKRVVADAKTSGPETEAKKASKLSDRLNATKRWIDAARRYSLLIPINIVWGWWVGVIIFKLLGGSENQIWIFLWEKHFWMTFLTPFIIMAPYFLIKSRVLILIAISVLIICILGGFWIVAIEKEFFVDVWTDNARLTTSYQGDRTATKPAQQTETSTIVDCIAGPEWSRWFDIPPCNFNIVRDGKIEVEAIYRGKTRKFALELTDDEPVGFIQRVRFRSMEKSLVQVQVIRTN